MKGQIKGGSRRLNGHYQSDDGRAKKRYIETFSRETKYADYVWWQLSWATVGGVFTLNVEGVKLLYDSESKTRLFSSSAGTSPFFFRDGAETPYTVSNTEGASITVLEQSEHGVSFRPNFKDKSGLFEGYFNATGTKYTATLTWESD